MLRSLTTAQLATAAPGTEQRTGANLTAGAGNDKHLDDPYFYWIGETEDDASTSATPSPSASAPPRATPFRRPHRALHQLHLQAVPAAQPHLAPGVYPDMTEQGFATDEWPALYERVLAADILVLCGPHLARRQQLGDEEGDRAAVQLLRDAQRAGAVGLLPPRRRLSDHRQRGRREALRDERPLQPPAPRYTIPPQADSGWIGPENDFTNRNTAFMTWNLVHLAALLKRSGGIPAHGNQRSEWDAGCRLDAPNPDYR